MAEHKHAAVLRAIADGKTVQCAPCGTKAWIDIDINDLQSHYDPITCQNMEWRIKPEPKPDVVLYRALGKAGDCRPFEGANICLTFDGETGKLKSAEVLP